MTLKFVSDLGRNEWPLQLLGGREILPFWFHQPLQEVRYCADRAHDK